jgi:hypothetical protein
MNIETIVKDWMTKTKWNGKSNATVSFEFGWRVESPHLFDIVEVIGKRNIQRFRSNSNFVIL